jgi:HlyD family secretion protein
MKRVVLIVLVLAAIAGGVYYALNRAPGEIVITGIVTTDDVIVSSQVQGRLQALKVRQGDLVKKGDLLATIAPGEWAADMSFFEQSERQAATQVSQGEAELRFEESQTSNEIAQAEANLAAAEAQVTQAQADVENARLTFEHEQEAYKRGAEGQQTYDQVRTAYEAQKARLEAVRKQRDAARAGVNVAKSSLEQVAMKRAALEVNKHQLAAAGAQKEKARVQLGYTDIAAPVDGIVDVRAALQGEVVTPGQAIVTLINPDDLWVRADVEETYIDRIHIGDELPVRLPSGKVLQGRVFFRGVDAGFATQRDVSRTKRDIKTFEVRLRCDNSDRSLAVGMTTYITLPLAATNPHPASDTQSSDGGR